MPMPQVVTNVPVVHSDLGHEVTLNYEKHQIIVMVFIVVRNKHIQPHPQLPTAGVSRTAVCYLCQIWLQHQLLPVRK